MGATKSTEAKPADTTDSVPIQQEDQTSLPELPPELWALISRFLHSINLGRMSLVSKQWHDLSWTYAHTLDTAFITSQQEFDRILIQVAKACQNPRSPGALHTLRLVPKRVSIRNAKHVFEQVNSLTCLRRLDLFKCKTIVWADLSYALDVLSQLVELSMRDCHLLCNPTPAGALPPLYSRLSELKNLKLLDLGQCQLTVEVFCHIREGLPKLEQLVLRAAEIKDFAHNEPEKSPLFHLAQMPYLKKLDMSQMTVAHQFLRGQNLKLLSESTSLQNLKLHSTAWALALEDLPDLKHLTSLKAGCLYKLGPNTSAALARFAPELRKLYLSLDSTDLEFQLGTSLNSLSNLTNLHLSHCRLTGFNPSMELRNLNSLTLDTCVPGEEGYNFLTSLENLTCLDILAGNTNNPHVPSLTGDGYASMLQSIGKLPNLIELSIPMAQNATFEALTTLSYLRCLHLCSVGFAFGQPPSDPISMLVCDKMKKVLPFWARSLSHLQVDHAINEASLQAVCSRLPGLYDLSIHIGGGPLISLVPTLQLTALQVLRVHVHRVASETWQPDIAHPTAQIKCS